MINNLVSIITPCFNCEKFIGQTIHSVIDQSLKDWEMIIVDDCSTDNSISIIKEIAENEPRIKPIFLKNNVGAGKARNAAIKVSTGKYLAFLDSDDIWVPNKLEFQIEFMRKNNYAFSHTSYGFIDEQGNIVKQTYHVGPRALSYKDLLKKTEIGCLTAMLNIEKIGKMYMPDLRRKQDYALWLSILAKGFKSYPLDMELAFYRHRKGSATNNKFSLIIEHFSFLYNIERLNIFRVLYYSFYWGINGIQKHFLSKFYFF